MNQKLELKEPTLTITKWLQTNIFHSAGNVIGQVCIVVIDGGSSNNIVSQALVDRLQF